MIRQHPYNPKCKCRRCKAVRSIVELLPVGKTFTINPSYDKLTVTKVKK